MGPRADQDAGAEPAGGADHSQDPGPGPESPGRRTQRADHGAAFHLRERELESTERGLALTWLSPFSKTPEFLYAGRGIYQGTTERGCGKTLSRASSS